MARGKTRQLYRKIGALRRDDERCHYCRCPLTLDTMTLDHKIPVSAGGKTTIQNLVAACEPCNKAKGAQSYAAFVRSGWRPKPKPIRSRPWDLPDDTTREYA